MVRSVIGMPAVLFASVRGVCLMNRGRSKPKMLRVSQWVEDGVKSDGAKAWGFARGGGEGESVDWVGAGDGDGEWEVGRTGAGGAVAVKVPGGGEGRGGGGGGGKGCDCGC